MLNLSGRVADRTLSGALTDPKLGEFVSEMTPNWPDLVYPRMRRTFASPRQQYLEMVPRALSDDFNGTRRLITGEPPQAEGTRFVGSRAAEKNTLYPAGHGKVQTS
jgi:hypothetical protein